MKKVLVLLLTVVMLVLPLLSSCGLVGTSVHSVTSSASKLLEDRISLKTGGKGLSSDVTLLTSEDASSLGIDVSAIEGGGYIVRSFGNDSVLVGSDDDMLDRAVRYFVKNCITEDGKLASDSINEVYRELGRVKRFILSGADISEYVITVPADASECVKFAADDLKNYIYKTCLVDIEVKTAPVSDKHVIAMEVDPTATGGGMHDGGDLGMDGYRITVKDGKMTILGGNMRGNMYGVYDFLENYVGWRFLSSNAGDKEYLYEADEINVDNLDYTYVPQFFYRGSTFPGSSDETFMKNRDNSADSWKIWSGDPRWGYAIGTMWYHAHSFAYQVDGYAPSEIYGQEHLLGLDYWNQPCFTDPDIRDNIVQSMLYLLEERVDGWGRRPGYDATFISCSMNDNENYCTCKNCRSSYKKEGNTMAGAYLEIINNAADIVGAEYPGMMVYAISYIDKIPKSIKPADNVVMHFCISGCNNHALANGECADHQPVIGRNNVLELQHLKDWVSISENIMVWYYASSFNCLLCPSPILTHFGEDFRAIMEMGVDGFYVESSSEDTYHYINSVQKYLSYKLMWNPDVTDEEYWAMVDEYLYLMYGDAGVCLREYIDMMETSTRTKPCWLNNYSYPFNMVDPSYYEMYYEDMKDLFDEALLLADTSWQEHEIRKALVSTDFLGLSATYESVYRNGSPEQKAEYEARYKSVIDGCNYYNIVIMRDNPDFKVPDNYSLAKGPMENFYKVENGMN